MQSPRAYASRHLMRVAVTVTEGFRSVFGPDRIPRVALAPGRVNLIGEHTDYNDGFVLPMAVDRHIAVAFAPGEGGKLRVHATAHAETREAELAALSPPGDGSWFAYVAGVAWALREAGHALAGADLVVAGDLPVGAGLSSSAALELAVARSLCAVAQEPWDPIAMARLCQRAEHEFAGVQCGIMDQLAAAVAIEGAALLVDCRSLKLAPVPLPSTACVVVMDTGVRRALAGSAYNERRAACAAAVEALRSRAPGMHSLRDVDGALLEAGREVLDPEVFQLVQHVVAETQRPPDMAEALGAGDVGRAGRLMNDSHWSLRDLYEVSSRELDLVTRLARSHTGCRGARMTGAGFGGCAVALVDAGGAEDFVATVSQRYRRHVESAGEFFVARPSAGARIV